MELSTPQAPAGFRVLQEGQAKILYKEEKLVRDEHD